MQNVWPGDLIVITYQLLDEVRQNMVIVGGEHNKEEKREENVYFVRTELNNFFIILLQIFL